MERKEFYERVLSLGDEYICEEILEEGKLKLHSQSKNNDVIFWGIMIDRFDKGPSPVLYLEEFFEEYNDGMPMEEIMNKIAYVYKRAWMDKPDMNHFDFTFEKVKSKIVFKVINFSKNKKGLKNLEHKKLGNDLAMIFVIRVNDDSVVNISKKLMEEFNYNSDDVYKYAMENTPRILPVCFKELLDFLDEDNLSQCNKGERFLYILTNAEKIYGASVVLYPGVLERIAEKLGGNFYAIPSSVHEWLVFPQDNDIRVENYHQMIKDINTNMVHSTEELSDYLFKYDATENEFFMVKDM